MCNLSGIKHYEFADISNNTAHAAVGLFWADGCLCILFAVLGYFRYSWVRVLHYSICMSATSNLPWVAFFTLTAISSTMNGLLFFLKKNEHHYGIVITGCILNLCSILFLAFAVNYQWKHREEAYDDLTNSLRTSETTPILYDESRLISLMKHSKIDAIPLFIFVLSCGFFIAAWIKKRNNFFWLALSFKWCLQIVVFVSVLIIHCKTTVQGPTVVVKCALLAGVLFNSISYIPSYIWLKCIFKYDDIVTGVFYDALVGLIISSHIVFFFVMRAEFLRLKDVARWHVASRIHDLNPTEE
ncbi:uncharacterized protein LOC124433567 [Xenia sp. Carnegie-2017]|uniref:uncharacterized protein LOC124433567 n=1 Tax=Xenia sp. Carnegie-2017 TaxID=2897299 RepID=UPI001F045ABA|nr:uncharacterized protein LOC124433567 [Xenia sp. Carnegie-2017]